MGEERQSDWRSTRRRIGRRRFLVGVGTGVAVGLAGCLGGNDGDTDVGAGADEHGIARHIDRYPSRGAEPFEETATLVVLDDPRCSACAGYHDGTVAQFKSSVVDEGRGTLVIRQYPVTYPEKGLVAANALRATYERSEEAFWGLQNHLFDNQNWSGEEALYRSESWLNKNTDIDGAAVVEDARNAKYEAAIEDTIRAGEDEGAGFTPYAFMFRGDEFRGSGNPGYSEIETTLEL